MIWLEALAWWIGLTAGFTLLMYACLWLFGLFCALTGWMEVPDE